jgi:hypothetical protein
MGKNTEGFVEWDGYKLIIIEMKILVRKLTKKPIDYIVSI